MNKDTGSNWKLGMFVISRINTIYPYHLFCWKTAKFVWLHLSIKITI